MANTCKFYIFFQVSQFPLNKFAVQFFSMSQRLEDNLLEWNLNELENKLKKSVDETQQCHFVPFPFGKVSPI